MKYVLVVHHDADLYGSDKSLLRTVRALRRDGLEPIVLLPHEGPLVKLVRAEGAEVHIGPVGKLTRQLLKPLALPWVVADMWRAVRHVAAIRQGRKIDLVYSNSVAALGGAIWAALNRVPRLWHVREIVVAPRVAAVGFPWMLRLLGGFCVCNSNATRDWIIGVCKGLAGRSSAIWNGLEPVQTPESSSVAAFREGLGIGADEVLVTLVGRINRWKGQNVLIEAARRLRDSGPVGLRFLIVGDVADGQHHFREGMLQSIQDAGLQDLVLWHPFTEDVDVVWASTDIAVVPSVEPEPFGRVAIEAMAHGVPVVASAHGGLAEIVVDGETGLLVRPGDAGALAEAIATLADSDALRARYGLAGRARQQTVFSQEEHDRQLIALMRRLAD